jgi:hypothetical protein
MGMRLAVHVRSKTRVCAKARQMNSFGFESSLKCVKLSSTAKKKTRKIPCSPADISSGISRYERESREAEATLAAQKLTKTKEGKQRDFSRTVRIRQK